MFFQPNSGHKHVQFGPLADRSQRYMASTNTVILQFNARYHFTYVDIHPILWRESNNVSSSLDAITVQQLTTEATNSGAH
jgi:hypothetical protein